MTCSLQHNSLLQAPCLRAHPWFSPVRAALLGLSIRPDVMGGREKHGDLSLKELPPPCTTNCLQAQTNTSHNNASHRILAFSKRGFECVIKEILVFRLVNIQFIPGSPCLNDEALLFSNKKRDALVGTFRNVAAVPGPAPPRPLPCI